MCCRSEGRLGLPLCSGAGTSPSLQRRQGNKRYALHTINHKTQTTEAAAVIRRHRCFFYNPQNPLKKAGKVDELARPGFLPPPAPTYGVEGRGRTQRRRFTAGQNRSNPTETGRFPVILKQNHQNKDPGVVFHTSPVSGTFD